MKKQSLVLNCNSQHIFIATQLEFTDKSCCGVRFNIRFHSMFDVGRSMLDVHLYKIIIEDPVFALEMISSELITSDHVHRT